MENSDSTPWVDRHLWLVRWMTAIFVAGGVWLLWWVDQQYWKGWLTALLLQLFELLLSWAEGHWTNVGVHVLLVMLTLFLAYANLYLKISVRAPNIQRRLTPQVFINVPFTIYFAVYLMLTILAYVGLMKSIQPWFVAVIAAALLGIGVGNADIKFGGFSVQPLAEFLKGLETVVEAGISTQISELDIAKRAALRDLLAMFADMETLERECRILEIKPEDIQKLRDMAGKDETTYRGLLAREIVKTSEANAERLIEEFGGPEFGRRLFPWRILRRGLEAQRSARTRPPTQEKGSPRAES